MNISKSNLSEHYAEILSSINETDYIAFDTEFTGLSDGLVRIHQYESLEDRYLKIKRHIELFWICQLGISFFKQGENQNQFTAKTFNIYMYPTNRMLNLSMSSMSFLVENGFDMNLLFSQAIPCTRAGLPCWNTQYSRQGSFSLSESNRAFIQELESLVLSFMSSNQQSISVPLESEHHKKLVFGSQGLAPRFRNIEMKCEKKNPLLLLIKKNKKKIAEYIPRTEGPPKQEAELSIGPLIMAILQKGVPLIGHYMILDVAFLYDHFIGPLPDSLEEFRLEIFNKFPTLYDTKYMTKGLFADVKFIRNTGVEELFGYCKKKKELSQLVDIKPHEKFQLSDQAHEAGYDAYMTGYVFINLLKFLAKPEDIKLAQNKICIQGHYKEFLDTEAQNVEDFKFDSVAKIKVTELVTVYELSQKLSKFADVFVVQEKEFVFFAEFYQITPEKMEEILIRLREDGYEAAKFIDRNMIL